MRTSASQSVELLIPTPDRAVVKLQVYVRAQLLEAIESGRLGPGSRLPSTRQLSLDLGIARGTVVEVYDQLIHEGYLSAAQGAGTVVAARVAHDRGHANGRAVSAQVIDLRPGGPDLRSFPRQLWSRAAAHVLKTLPDAALGDVHPMGTTALRSELVLHLGRTRLLVTDLGRVAVTTGVAHGLALLSRILLARGTSVLAVEDPSSAVYRKVLDQHGLTVLDVPVDGEGIRVDLLRSTGVRAVLVTPSPQFPTGVLMSARRRERLTAWAADVGALIVEVDADFQLRNVAEPSLHAALPGQVVHLSSVSTTLVPGVGVGWLVVPEQLREQLPRAVDGLGSATSVFDQHILARLLWTGEYDKHIRKQRAAYRAKRTALVDALERHLPQWSVRGADAGLNLWIEPEDPVDELRLTRLAAGRGLLVDPMALMRHDVDVRGLVLGFAQLSSHAAEPVAKSLADVVALCPAG